MNLTVFGAGGVGGQVAARLALAGIPVNLIARGPHLDAIRQGGLRLQVRDEIRPAMVNATDNPRDIGVQDVVVISVKRTSLTGVRDTLMSLIGEDTRVVFIMNGLPWWFDEAALSASDRLRHYLDPGNEMAHVAPIHHQIWGVITSGGAIVAPGVVRSTTPETNIIRLGYADDRKDDRILALSQVLLGAGYDAAVADAIRTEVWRKILVNAGQAVVATVTNRNHRQVTSDEDTRLLIMNIISELIALGHEFGIEINADPVKMTDPQKYGEHVPSLLQDLRRGRPLEIDSTILAVRELARLRNIVVPHLEAAAAIVSAMSKDICLVRSDEDSPRV